MDGFCKAQPADMPSPDVDFATWLTARNMASVPLLVDVEVELSTNIVWRRGVDGPVLFFRGPGRTNPQRAGRRIAPNRVRFEDIPIDDNFFPQEVTITNIRTDALRMGIVSPGGMHEIVAKVRARDGIRDVTIKNVQVAVAFFQSEPSLCFSFDPPWPTAVHLSELSTDDVCTDGARSVTPTLTLRLLEPFAGAFKTRAEEAGVSIHPTDQVADSGTLFSLILDRIPNGISIYVSVNDLGDNIDKPSVRLISAKRDALLFANDAPGPVLIGSNGIRLVRLDVVDQSAAAVWEWVSSESLLLDRERRIALGLFLTATRGTVGTGTIMATVSLAPGRFSANLDSLPVPCFGILRGASNCLSIK
jgi:hypothetical protein